MHQVQNQKKAYELGALAVGFDPDQVKELTDTSDYGDENIMAEAYRDIEMILDGEDVKPNQSANTAYAQRIVDYMQDNFERLSPKEFQQIKKYYDSLKPIIMRNMVKRANDVLFKQQMESLSSVGTTASPDQGNIDPAQAMMQANPLNGG